MTSDIQPKCPICGETIKNQPQPIWEAPDFSFVLCNRCGKFRYSHYAILSPST